MSVAHWGNGYDCASSVEGSNLSMAQAVKVDGDVEPRIHKLPAVAVICCGTKDPEK
jgi:hypothetical protein